MTNHLGRVSIVVLTYKRTDDLSELLPLLHAQIEGVNHDDFEILVVDNDPDASARPIVASDLSPRTRYVNEPSPGIAHARNRALDETSGSRLLIFIDDDERPLDAWLESMLSAYGASRPAGVTGPLYPEYEMPPDEWIVAGGFFVRKLYPEGYLMPAAGTGNLLLDLDQVGAAGLRFDTRFGLTGGSDTLFTRKLIKSGGRIVWAAGAGLIDKVPGQRLSKRWVLRRFYRVGNTWSRSSVELADPGVRRFATRLRLTGLGAGRLCYGAVRTVFGSLSRSKKHQARGMRAVRRGLGMIAGAWGSAYEEYRRIQQVDTAPPVVVK
jgi:glycosyltransferase involved in cell wall biosynthesis